MLRRLLCFLWLFSAGFADPAAALPSTFLEDSVDIITGSCVITAEDLEVRGAEPIYITRQYVSGTKKKKKGGWVFLPHLFLKFDRKTDIIKVKEPTGNAIYFYVPLTLSKELTPLYLEEEYSIKNLAYCKWETLSGENNIKKIEAFISRDERWIYVLSANGCSRLYTRNSHQNKRDEEAPWTYHLKWEELPSGNIQSYSYDKHYRLKKIQTTNSSRTKIFASCNLNYREDDPKQYPDFAALSWTGDFATYLFEYNGKERLPKHQLITVEPPEKPKETFQYSHERAYRGRLISERKTEKQTTHQYRYYRVGDRTVPKGDGQIKNDEDPRVDRVKEILAPVGNDEKLIPKYRLFYKINEDRSGSTQVYDSENNLTIYHYNTYLQTTKIQRFDANNNPVNTELFIWGEKEYQADLQGRVALNAQEEPIIAQTYKYDDWGNIIEETLWGQITGNTPLTLNEQLFPIDNGIDKATKKYQYDAKKHNLLIYEEDEKGIQKEYHYFKNTELTEKSFAKIENKIIKRSFYQYSDDHLLIKEIHDDGQSKDPSDISGITQRNIKTYTLNEKEFLYGMIERIEEKYLDIETNQERPLRSIHLLYTPKGQIASKRLYDADGNFQYEKNYEYDKHNQLIKETNAIGQVAEATYNDLLKKETQTGFDGILTYSFKYNATGNIIEKKSKNPSEEERAEYYSYNSNQACTKHVDIFGNMTEYLYDSQGNCIETILPQTENGRISIQKTYNALSQITSTTDGNGNTTHTQPNILNKPLEILHPDGTKESFTYNLDGTLATSIDPAGTKTQYTYDPFHRVTSKSIYSSGDELLTQETFEYDTLHLISETDPMGNKIQYHYDNAGRKIAQTKANLTTKFSYDSLGRLSTTQVGDCITKTEYNLLNQPIKETLEDTSGNLLSIISYSYDQFGNKQTTERNVDGVPAIEIAKYDSYHRLIRLTDPENNVTHIKYETVLNSLGQFVLQKTQLLPNGNQIIETYDALERLIKRTTHSPLGTLLSGTEFQYDQNHNPIQQTETVTQNDHSWEIVTKKTFTPTNKISLLTEAAGTKEQKHTRYIYDTAGRLTEIQPPNHTSIQYSYDPLSRIAILKTKEVEYHYTYDKLGRTTAIQDNIHHTTTFRSYDTQGNMQEERLANGLTIKNTYDPLRRRTQLILPDQSSVEYEYDSYYLRQINRKDAKQNITHTHQFLHYDLSGNLLEETTGSYQYNRNGQKDTIETPHFTQYVQERDSMGNILYQKTNDNPEHFTYSPLSQLLSEPTNEYSYDSMHNRVSKNEHPYLLNNNNQLLATDSAQYHYDQAGYPTSKKTRNQLIEYTYDGLGRLIEAKEEKRWRLLCAYDGFHRRTTKILYTWRKDTWVETQYQKFLYDENNEIGSTDKNNTICELRILGHAPHAEIGAAIAIELKGQNYIPIHDIRGSILALTRNNEIIQEHHYTAFGETDSPPTPWGFCSKRHDPETALINFGRRYYDPETGRFLTPDPKGFTDGPNLYTYCHNNPLNKIDLYGLYVYIEFSIDIKDLFSGLAFASTFLGNAIYNASYHSVPIQPFRKLGMGIGNLLSWNKRPYFSPPSSIGTINGHTPINASALFINGILNEKEDTYNSAAHFSSALNNMKVDYFHSTTRGFVADIFAAFWGMLGFQTADSIQIALTIRRQLQALQSDTQTSQLFVIAHSRGGIYLNNALKLLTPEEKQMIHAYTFGSASLFSNPQLASLTHYVASTDPVPMLDPIAYLKARFGKSSNVEILPSQGNLLAHEFLGDIYSNQLRLTSKDIRREIGEP